MGLHLDAVEILGERLGVAVLGPLQIADRALHGLRPETATRRVRRRQQEAPDLERPAFAGAWIARMTSSRRSLGASSQIASTSGAVSRLSRSACAWKGPSSASLIAWTSAFRLPAVGL